MVNKRTKGQRLERLTEKELQKEGYITYRVKGSTKFNKNVDIFGLFDILAINSSIKKWVQVKCQKPDLTQFKQFKSKYLLTSDIIEIWIWKNRKGWNKIIM